MSTTCPNCGKENSAAASICLCGELLRADVTNVQGWETETVFRPVEAQTLKSRRLAAILITLAILTIMLGLAWPRLREHWNEEKDERVLENTPTTSNQNPSQSDIVPSEDIVQTDPLIKDAKSGVFNFSARNINAASDGRSLSRRNIRAANVQTVAAAQSGIDPYDAELLDNDSSAAKPTGENQKPDCKPDVSVPLKKTEPTEDRSAVKLSETKGYVLGPRGGCFIVTPGGGKKYVDRALCATSAAAGSRQ